VVAKKIPKNRRTLSVGLSLDAKKTLSQSYAFCFCNPNNIDNDDDNIIINTNDDTTNNNTAYQRKYSSL